MKAGGRDRGSFAGEVAGISFSDGTDSWSLAPKACDFCKSSAAVLFCRADSAFLCIDCDLKVHAANKLASRHERVWMCEVCEQAPASVTCKADAAALCVACDNDIHSANPLARRHERYPVVPFYEPAAVAKAAAASSFLVPAVDGDGLLSGEAEEEGEDVDENGNVNSKSEDAEAEAEAASWLLPNPKDCEMKTAGGDYFFPEVDPYLDLEYASPIDRSFHHHHHHHNGSDSVVPVQKAAVPVMNTTLCGTDLESNFGRSKPKFGYATSISHSVSSSSLDVGVVPDGSSLTDISNPYSRGVMKTTMDLCSPNSTIPSVTVTQLSPLDREARVLRYREKRKNRKFEKTIRYVSRKAYAETRPRIKGRFAKRTEIEVEVDRIYSSASILAETGYGIVPSF